MTVMQTRKIQRKTITLPGRYFTGRGEPVDVAICDLSPGGCRFTSAQSGIVPGSRIQMFLASSGPHHGTVKWVAGGEVGVTFATPLSEEQFKVFQNSHVPDLPENLETSAFDETPQALPNRFC